MDVGDSLYRLISTVPRDFSRAGREIFRKGGRDSSKIKIKIESRKFVIWNWLHILKIYILIIKNCYRVSHKWTIKFCWELSWGKEKRRIKFSRKKGKRWNDDRPCLRAFVDNLDKLHSYVTREGWKYRAGEGKEWSRVGQVWSRVSWGKVTKYILQRWCHPSTLSSSSFLISSTFLATRVFVLKTICRNRKMIDSPPPLRTR